MNCVCGHSVFDHAKVYERKIVEYPIGVPAFFFILPTFTLSGRCEACAASDLAIGRSVACVRFRRTVDLVDLSDFLRNEANFWRDVCDMDPRPIHGMSRERVATGADLLASAETVAPAKAEKAWDGLLKPIVATAFDRGLSTLEWREWWKKYDRAPEPGPSEVM